MTNREQSKLQLALAKELPELICHEQDRDELGLVAYEGFSWRDTYEEITSREWSWIADECWRRWFKSNGEDYRNYSFFSSEADWELVASAYFLATNKSI